MLAEQDFQDLLGKYKNEGRFFSIVWKVIWRLHINIIYGKKKSLLQLWEGLDLNHTSHSGTYMTNIITATHGNHHSLGDSAVGIVEKSRH